MRGEGRSGFGLVSCPRSGVAKSSIPSSEHQHATPPVTTRHHQERAPHSSNRRTGWSSHSLMGTIPPTHSSCFRLPRC